MIKSRKAYRFRGVTQRKISVFLLCFCFLAFDSNATAKTDVTMEISQVGREVKGLVTDSHKEPLIGVTVREKGTSNGAITNVDGSFTLKLTSAKAILEFSYMGYSNQEVAVGGKSTIDVVMTEDAIGLDEFVLVGYAQQRKSSIAGSISTINADKMKNISSPSVASLLQGKVAGVTVGGASGQPGSAPTITIRGRGSISTTTSPLWVIDGVVDGMTTSLNNNDIESITVLKDGSATALYGSRGANGVILVTTKRAKAGDNRIDISAKLGVVTPQRGRIRMMNGQELYTYTEQAFENSADGVVAQWFTADLLENDINWWDIATKTALSQNYTVSLTMGNDKIRSYLSADYYKEEGTIKGYDYQRYTVRNNNEYVVNNKLTLKTKINASYSETDDKQRSLAFTNLPWDTPTNTLGEIKTGKEGNDISTDLDMKDYWFGRDASNYLYDLQYNWSNGRTIAAGGNFGLEYKIYDGLAFESTENISFSHGYTESYVDPRSQEGLSDKGSVSNGNSLYTSLYNNQMLKYAKLFGKHDVLAYAAFEYNQTFNKSNSATGKGIPVGGEVLGVTTTPSEVSGEKYKKKTISYFFNANYTFDDRFFGQFSIRRDGSSKFGRDKRFGTFATIGGGWNINKESFMKDVSFVDALKLRVSYGSTGNTPSSGFSHMGLYQINLNYNGYPAAFPSQMANRNMTWEKVYNTNIGIDARLFDRVGITLDYYNKDTSGLLYSQQLSALTGYSSRWINEGKMWNRGFEVTISPEIIKTEDFYWSIDANLGYNKSKITELAGGKTQEITGNTIRQIGHALGTYYMKEWAGVNPIDGTPQWYAIDADGNKYVVSNEADATFQTLDKRQYPNLQGGIATNFQYRDFTLTANFTFASGFYIYHYGRQDYDNDGVEIQYNSMKLKDGWSRWEKPGDIATHPQVMYGGNNSSNIISTRYLERGDFFKMQSLSLNYNIPAKLLKNYGLRSANFSVGAENLFTATDFSGVDPELGINGDALAQEYSTPRRVTFTLNIGF